MVIFPNCSEHFVQYESMLANYFFLSDLFLIDDTKRYWTQAQQEIQKAWHLFVLKDPKKNHATFWSFLYNIKVHILVLILLDLRIRSSIYCSLLRGPKGQSISKTNYGVLNSPEKHFCKFFGRIEDTIICFRDWMTFRYWMIWPDFFSIFKS